MSFSRGVGGMRDFIHRNKSGEVRSTPTEKTYTFTLAGLQGSQRSPCII